MVGIMRMDCVDTYRPDDVFGRVSFVYVDGGLLETMIDIDPAYRDKHGRLVDSGGCLITKQCIKEIIVEGEDVNIPPKGFFAIVAQCRIRLKAVDIIHLDLSRHSGTHSWCDR